MPEYKPAAFLSYVHFDDEHDGGKITEFRKRLSAEVHVQTGQQFIIFQDKDIEWGQNWQKRIKRSLNSATFLIPVITPNFFNSEACLEELEIFLKREAKLKRDDLILPVYYIECPILSNNKGTRRKDKLARILSTRQYFDWRELRFEPLTSAQVTKTLAQLAIFVRNAMMREDRKQFESKSRTKHSKKQIGEADKNAKSNISTELDKLQSAASSNGLTSSPASKTELTTFIVDQMQRGDFITIGEAVEAAKPGSLILIRRGLYKESILVNKPLEIIGDGNLGEVEVRGDKDYTFLLMTSMARIANLKITYDIDIGQSVITIAQGRVDIENCDISSSSINPLVWIRNGSDPRLRYNTIHGISKIGIEVIGNSKGTIEDNEIFVQDGNGLFIVSGTTRMTRNRIHGSKQGAVIAGNCTLEDNEVFANDMGLTVFEAASPILRRNRIHHNKYYGIWQYGDSQAAVEGNEINGNLIGVTIGDRARPVLRENQIHSNTAGGVVVQEQAISTLEENIIRKNKESGIIISGEARATLRKNKIEENEGIGIIVLKDGGGTFEGNGLLGNTGGAWKIDEGKPENINRKENAE